jgi:hypothetical protein
VREDREREGRRLAEERSKLRSCGRGEQGEEGGVAGKGTCSLPSHHLAGLLSSLTRFSYFFSGELCS